MPDTWSPWPGDAQQAPPSILETREPTAAARGRAREIWQQMGYGME